MIDIKTDFREWLVKDKKYKSSTTKQFIGAINKVCKNFLGGCADEHWNTLAQNIVPVLVYYNECNNHEYYISKDDTGILEKHFNNNVLKYLRSKTSLNGDIFPNVRLIFIYNAKEYFVSEVPLNLVPSYIKAFQFIVNQIAQNILRIDDLLNLYTLAKMQDIFTGDLSVFFNKITAIISDNPEANKTCAYLYLQYTETYSKQITKTLWLFYEYINAKVPKTKPHFGYDELKNLIVCINNAHDGLIKIVTKVAWTGNQAKEIKATNGKGTLYPYEVQEALDCSHKVFRELVEQGLLKPTEKNGRYYKDSDVNNLLEKAFYKVTYPDVDYTQSIPVGAKIREHPEIWCTRESAAKILNRNISSIDLYKREKLLTYVEVVRNSAFFYVPELNKIAKILKKYPLRGSKRILTIKLKSVIKQ